MARPSSFKPEYAERVCDFGDYERLGACAALTRLSERPDVPGFKSESEYRAWFVREAVAPIVNHMYAGAAVLRVTTETALGGTGLRLDVLAALDDGRSVGFELKARNPRNPQNGRYELVQGIGQALLYQDVLRALRGAHSQVHLVSDHVHEAVAELMMRHGLMVGLIEANQDRVVCMAALPVGLN